MFKHWQWKLETILRNSASHTLLAGDMKLGASLPTLKVLRPCLSKLQASLVFTSLADQQLGLA